VLELQADYSGENVSVTNLTNADTVIYSGHDLDDLTLANAAPLGDINLTMAQDDCVAVDFGAQDHVIEDLFVTTLGDLNLVSTGPAANEITGADDINANVSIVGDSDLTLGSKAEPYDFHDGVIDASAFTGDLTVFIGDGEQTVFGGLGNDTIDVVDQDPNEPDLIDLSFGGTDTVIFEDTNQDDDDALTSANYTTIEGFDLANDVVAIDVLGPVFQIDLQQTNGLDVDPGDDVSMYPLIFGVNDNLTGVNVNYIKMPSVSSIGFDFDATFDFYMNAFGGTDIDVAGSADLILMSMYDTNGNNMVLFTVEPDSGGTPGLIDAGDDVQMVGLVPMSLADYNAFGITGASGDNGLAFVAG
jgi:hypothetical protein